ncbi:hypothetical protein BLNAU_19860 [Blattamonas nauphoetae]|uniref:Uncharacterized protein n=1 Tax=Blattamonas nauphoetae TaxID=2049346 RepID=A0ABQ9X4H8_9EUKA|nr:hypothetical protein BLNAU_19860 [Blattamonas nauphoetae]
MGLLRCLLIPLVAGSLPNGQYVLKLRSSSSEYVSFTVTFHNSVTNPIEAVVYSKDASEINLKYGETYTVEDLSKADVPLLQNLIPLSFVIPPEPKRIEEGRVTLNGAKDEATILLKGIALPDESYRLILTSVSSELTSEASLNDDGEVVFKVPISTSPTSILAFGQNYTVSSLKIGSESVVVNSDVELAVPKAPIATTTSCTLDTASNSKFTVTFTGSNLPTSGSFVVSFDGLTQTIAVTMNSSGGFSSLVEVNTTTEIKFGQIYTILSIVEKVDGKEDEHILCSGLTMTTPDGPSLLKIDSATLNKNDLNRVVLGVSFENMVGGSFEMKVTNSATSSEFVLSSPIIVTSHSRTGTVTELVYESEKLEYGASYTIVSLESSTLPILIKDTAGFTVPPAPTRIKSCSCELGGEDKKSAILRMGGVNLPVGKEITATMKELRGEELVGSAITVSWRWEGSGTVSSGDVSVVVYGADSVRLRYETSYCVTSLVIADTPSVLDPKVTFIVPEEPARVENASPTLNSLRTSVIVELRGRELKSGSFSVTLSSHPSNPITCPSTNGVVRFEVSTVTSNSIHLGFGDTVTIMKVMLGLDEVFVNSNTLLEYTLSSPIVTTLGSVTGALTELVYKSGKLEYGTSYTIVSLESSTLSVLIKDTAEFTVPDEPKRIEEGRETLNGVKNEATVRLKGRALTDGSYTLTLNSVSSELTSEASLSEDGELLFKVPISLLPTSILTFGQNYTISSLKFGSDNVVVNSDVKLAVPNPPIVKTAEVHPNSINTTITLGLTGTDLRLDGFYTVTLTPPNSFDMLFNNSETTSSPELLLGCTGSLQHNSKYTIESITRVGNDSDVILTAGAVSFTTPKLPVPLVLHVNQKEGEDDQFCGENDHPCSTIDFAWSIVSALKAKTATLAIVNSSQQSQPIFVSAGMSILFTNGGNLEPTLTIPSKASMATKAGIIVVDNAGFEVIDVTIRIESTDPSFVFLSASESTIILKEGSFVGEPLPTLASNSESENICSWNSGIIKLDNCIATLNRMTFSSISQGAIHMKTGTLTFRESSFDGNSPNLDSFPSAHRNIRCVEGGNVTIGSLSGGDGSTDKHPHLWISTTDCTLSGDDARPDSPLFIPTLSSKSESSWNKNEKQFSVTIVGTMMIPCGLSLKVFEIKKDKSEGKSEIIELSLGTADSFNETHITLSVPLTSLSLLDKSLEWQGRLVFGLNQTTTDSFVVQKNSADRMAQSSLDNMKWWIPLVIVLSCCALVVIFLVVLILRRRKQQKTQKGLATQQESQNEMEEEKIDVEQIDNEGGNAVRTSAGVLKGGTLNPERGDEAKPMLTKQMDTPLAECVSVLDCAKLETKEMLKMETLFDRLHRNKKGLLDKRAKQIELTRGLQKLGKLNPHADVLLHLSSHWILIDVDGRLRHGFGMYVKLRYVCQFGMYVKELRYVCQNKNEFLSL